jgi:cell shape-determining protein MreC
MSYRYDKEKKNKRLWYSLGSVLLVLFLFTPMYSVLFGFFQKTAIGTWENKQDIYADTSNFFQSFAAKQKILEKNKELKRDKDRLEIDNLRTQFLAEQLENIAAIGSEQIISAVILDYGSLGSYDHIILNKGFNLGVAIGDKVIMVESVTVGYISEVYSQTSRVTLYSDSEQSINGILYPYNEILTALGNGGGNLIIETPRQIKVEKGDIFFALDDPGNIIAVVEYVEFDPRDPFKKVYLNYPINLKQHQIVGIKKNLTQPE